MSFEATIIRLEKSFFKISPTFLKICFNSIETNARSPESILTPLAWYPWSIKAAATDKKLKTPEFNVS